MKLLVLLCAVFIGLQAQAGIIKNKKTGDSVLFDLDTKSKKTVIITDINGEQDAAEISMREYGYRTRDLNYIYKDEAPLANPFGAVEALVNAEVPSDMKVVFFVPALALDTLLLPIAIPASLLNQDSYGKFKKDIKLVQKAMDCRDEIAVSHKQFKRIMNITNYLMK